MKSFALLSIFVALVTFLMGTQFFIHSPKSNRLLTHNFINRLNYAMSKQPATFEKLGFGFSILGFGCVEIIDKNNGDPVAYIFEDEEQKYVIGRLQDTDLKVDEKKASEIIEKLVLPGKQDRITEVQSLRAKVFALTEGMSDQQIERIGTRCVFD